MTKYEIFLERNGLEDTEENRRIYEDGIRRVNLFLAIESIKSIAGEDDDETL